MHVDLTMFLHCYTALQYNVFTQPHNKAHNNARSFPAHFSIWLNKVQFGRPSLLYTSIGESLTICIKFLFLSNVWPWALHNSKYSHNLWLTLCKLLQFGICLTDVMAYAPRSQGDHYNDNTTNSCAITWLHAWHQMRWHGREEHFWIVVLPKNEINNSTSLTSTFHTATLGWERVWLHLVPNGVNMLWNTTPSFIKDTMTTFSLFNLAKLTNADYKM